MPLISGILLIFLWLSGTVNCLQAVAFADSRLSWVHPIIETANGIQQRNSTSDSVIRNYYWFGFSQGSDDFFYTRDHLGTVREVVADNGTTIESRYDYDLWGNVTRTAGTGAESDFLYTGHFFHQPSGLHLAPYRAYDSQLGRWLSRDPAGFIDGPNLYAYVLNNPVSYYDPTGEAVPLVVVGGIWLGKELLGWGVDKGLDYVSNNYLDCSQQDMLDNVRLGKDILQTGTGSLRGIRNLGARAAKKTPPPKQRNKPPEQLSEADGRPHTIIEKPGADGQYTTYNADGSW